jgi:hypothetical protein
MKILQKVVGALLLSVLTCGKGYGGPRKETSSPESLNLQVISGSHSQEEPSEISSSLLHADSERLEFSQRPEAAKQLLSVKVIAGGVLLVSSALIVRKGINHYRSPSNDGVPVTLPLSQMHQYPVVAHMPSSFSDPRFPVSTNLLEYSFLNALLERGGGIVFYLAQQLKDGFVPYIVGEGCDFPGTTFPNVTLNPADGCLKTHLSLLCAVPGKMHPDNILNFCSRFGVKVMNVSSLMPSIERPLQILANVKIPAPRIGEVVVEAGRLFCNEPSYWRAPFNTVIRFAKDHFIIPIVQKKPEHLLAQVILRGCAFVVWSELTSSFGCRIVGDNFFLVCPSRTSLPPDILSHCTGGMWFGNMTGI